MATMELKDEKFYKPIEKYLQEVNRNCVQISHEEKSTCVNLVLDAVNSVLESLKAKDDFFNKIVNKLEHVGSFFDNLRVKKADEFDLNIIIKLPKPRKNAIKVSNHNVKAGFVKADISAVKNCPEYTIDEKKVIDQWCDENFLDQDKFRRWLESLFIRTFRTFPTPIKCKNETRQVSLKKSGPAFTITIIYDQGNIDIDLVFVFEICDKPPSPIRTPEDPMDPWVIVPKPLNNSAIVKHNLNWRISFSTSEKKLIGNLHKLKCANRLLKALRDQQNLTMPSYYIKTLFLWEAHDVKQNNNKKKFWEKNLGYLFVYSLMELQNRLAEKKLPFYWHKSMNLFDSINKDHLKNMEGCIKRIRKDIEKHLTNGEDSLRRYIFNLFNITEITELPTVEMKVPIESIKHEESTDCRRLLENDHNQENVNNWLSTATKVAAFTGVVIGNPKLIAMVQLLKEPEVASQFIDLYFQKKVGYLIYNLVTQNRDGPDQPPLLQASTSRELSIPTQMKNNECPLCKTNLEGAETSKLRCKCRCKM